MYKRQVTYLDVDENGFVKPEELEAAIREETILISIMYANNEIGTIEPIREIGEIAKKHGIIFHTDAVQAYCQVPINVDEEHIDMLSASGHKLNGPKGIGFLYVRKGVRLKPVSYTHLVDMRAFFIERGFGGLKQRYFNRVQYIESGDERSIA